MGLWSDHDFDGVATAPSSARFVASVCSRLGQTEDPQLFVRARTIETLTVCNGSHNRDIGFWQPWVLSRKFSSSSIESQRTLLD